MTKQFQIQIVTHKSINALLHLQANCEVNKVYEVHQMKSLKCMTKQFQIQIVTHKSMYALLHSQANCRWPKIVTFKFSLINQAAFAGNKASSTP